jgi:Protein of unknown function (DUF3352)
VVFAAGLAVGRGLRRERVILHSALQRAVVQGRLRVLRGRPSLGGALWRTLSFRSAVAALAVVVAGCGGGAAGGDIDPATAVPTDALVYVEALVRPEGSQREEALEAAGKVLATDDPEGEIRRRLEAELELDYERDVEPWLGERVAFWMREGSGALLLAATDTEEARAWLEDKSERGSGRVTERSYRDRDYVVHDHGMTWGIVDDFVVIGTEPALKRTIDAAEGDSLAEADRYTDGVDELEDERLAHLWLDTPGLVELAREHDPELDQLSALVPFDEMPPVVASFSADGEALRVESKVRGLDRAGLGPLLGGGSTPLVQDLPGDAWVAGGTADAGETLRRTIDEFAGPIGGLALRREVRRRTGLDLDRDLLDWVGHVGFFVRGTTPETVDGGLVIQPTDEERAADAFPRLVGAIQVATGVRARPVDVAGADQAFELALHPRQLVLARASGLVVVTRGRAAAEAALGSGDRLGDGDVYGAAEELVGMAPALLVSMPELIELAAADDDPDFERARPYLEQLTVIAAGMTTDDDTATGRLAAGLK